MFGATTFQDKTITIVYYRQAFQVTIPYISGVAGLLSFIEKQLGGVSLSGCKIVDGNDQVAELHWAFLHPNTTYYDKAAVEVSPKMHINVKDKRLVTALECWNLESPSQIFPPEIAPRVPVSDGERATESNADLLEPSDWTCGLITSIWKLAKNTVGIYEEALGLMIEAREIRQADKTRKNSEVVGVMPSDI